MNFYDSSNRYALVLGAAGLLALVSSLFFASLNLNFFGQQSLTRIFAENGLAESIQNLTLLLSAVFFFVFSKQSDVTHKPVFYIFCAASLFMFSREFELNLSEDLEEKYAILDTLKVLFRVSFVLTIVFYLVKVLKSWNLFKGFFKQYFLSPAALAVYIGVAFLMSGWPFDRIKGLVANPEYFEEFLETNGYFMWCLCSCILHKDIQRIRSKPSS